MAIGMRPEFVKRLRSGITSLIPIFAASKKILRDRVPLEVRA
jgi:hypothetical protein